VDHTRTSGKFPILSAGMGQLVVSLGMLLLWVVSKKPGGRSTAVCHRRGRRHDDVATAHDRSLRRDEFIRLGWEENTEKFCGSWREPRNCSTWRSLKGAFATLTMVKNVFCRRSFCSISMNSWRPEVSRYGILGRSCFACLDIVVRIVLANLRARAVTMVKRAFCTHESMRSTVLAFVGSLNGDTPWRALSKAVLSVLLLLLLVRVVSLPSRNLEHTNFIVRYCRINAVFFKSFANALFVCRPFVSGSSESFLAGDDGSERDPELNSAWKLCVGVANNSVGGLTNEWAQHIWMDPEWSDEIPSWFLLKYCWIGDVLGRQGQDNVKGRLALTQESGPFGMQRTRTGAQDSSS
jgi:hypothetical protein